LRGSTDASFGMLRPWDAVYHHRHQRVGLKRCECTAAISARPAMNALGQEMDRIQNPAV
jgi:hypothetical protein